MTQALNLLSQGEIYECSNTCITSGWEFEKDALNLKLLVCKFWQLQKGGIYTWARATNWVIPSYYFIRSNLISQMVLEL